MPPFRARQKISTYMIGKPPPPEHLHSRQMLGAALGNNAYRRHDIGYAASLARPWAKARSKSERKDPRYKSPTCCAP